jgi:hypothetical protein
MASKIWRAIRGPPERRLVRISRRGRAADRQHLLLTAG